MKKVIRLLSVLLCVALLTMGLAGCGTTDEGKTFKIGIIQYMSHPSLDNCYTGIIQGLDASGIAYTADRQIGSAASASVDCTSFAQNMVAQGCDMIIAIATPAATTAFAAVQGTDIPLIFCSVSDAVKAELVVSNEAPGKACTGTSDRQNQEAQLAMIHALQPTLKTLGVLYTTSEQNSIASLEALQAVCDAKGVKLEASGVQNASDIPAAATALAGKVEAITNFTDNNVVENLSVVLDAANAANIPVYGSEIEQVKLGCVGSESIDYVAVGRTTGDMAAKVLGGEDPSAMPVAIVTDSTPVFNSDVLAKLGLTLPATYANAETVTNG